MHEALTLNEYQRRAMTTAIYPPEDAVDYPALKLFNEAGEVAGKIAKALRDDGRIITGARADAIGSEAGDTTWYLAALSRDLDLELKAVARAETFRQLHGRVAQADDPLRDLKYYALRLAVETGEIARLADEMMDLPDAAASKHRDAIAERMAPVLYNLAGIVAVVGLRYESVAQANLAKLADRAARGVIGGDGDKR